MMTVVAMVDVMVALKLVTMKMLVLQVILRAIFVI